MEKNLQTTGLKKVFINMFKSEVKLNPASTACQEFQI